MTAPLRGNPVKRRAGIVVRAVLISLVGRKPMPMAEVIELTGKSRSRVLQHLALLQEAGRISGYSSAGGVLRVWMEEER